MVESTDGILTAGAIVLAAGMSRRMGRPKALLDLGGQPLVRRVVQGAFQSQCIHPIIVVTGHEPQLIHQALAGMGVSFVQNPQYEAGGMLSSVKTGVEAIRDYCDAYFLMLLDQPLVHPMTLKALWKAWQTSCPAIVAPRHRGKRGHPILLACRYADSVLSLPQDASLRNFVLQQRAQTQVVDVTDPGVLSDVDTPADYQVIRRLWDGDMSSHPKLNRLGR